MCAIHTNWLPKKKNLATYNLKAASRLSKQLFGYSGLLQAAVLNVLAYMAHVVLCICYILLLHLVNPLFHPSDNITIHVLDGVACWRERRSSGTSISMEN